VNKNAKDRLDWIEEVLHETALLNAQISKELLEDSKQFRLELKQMRDEHNREMKEIRVEMKEIRVLFKQMIKKRAV
jgi:hypothetical protein